MPPIAGRGAAGTAAAIVTIVVAANAAVWAGMFGLLGVLPAAANGVPGAGRAMVLCLAAGACAVASVVLGAASLQRHGRGRAGGQRGTGRLGGAVACALAALTALVLMFVTASA
ncbi:MAG: hypothetical protein EPN43_11060 [Jatrophihabitans sp.]|nr:MAG: hypothetical protein EPN43_11060 [Jatrophihabitans sp.]